MIPKKNVTILENRLNQDIQEKYLSLFSENEKLKQFVYTMGSKEEMLELFVKMDSRANEAYISEIKKLNPNNSEGEGDLLYTIKELKRVTCVKASKKLLNEFPEYKYLFKKKVHS